MLRTAPNRTWRNQGGEARLNSIRKHQPLDAEQAGDTTTQADQTHESVVVMQSEPRPEDATVEQKSTVSKGQANTRTTSQGNRRFRRLGLIALLAAGVVGGGLWLWPRILLALHTVSTDDAYVAGHVTYIAPRIPGTILKVHVDDNQFVNKDQLIVELDSEPYQISVDRAAAVTVAKAQVQEAETQSRAIVAGIRAAYNNLKLTMDHVTEGIAKLKASLATREKTRAQRALAEVELRRAKNLLQSNSGTQQVVDQREAAYQVAVATEIEAHEQVHLARAALGLSAVPPPGEQLADVP